MIILTLSDADRTARALTDFEGYKNGVRREDVDIGALTTLLWQAGTIERAAKVADQYFARMRRGWFIDGAGI